MATKENTQVTAAPKKRGRPPGSKNNKKSVVQQAKTVATNGGLNEAEKQLRHHIAQLGLAKTKQVFAQIEKALGL